MDVEVNSVLSATSVLSVRQLIEPYAVRKPSVRSAVDGSKWWQKSPLMKDRTFCSAYPYLFFYLLGVELLGILIDIAKHLRSRRGQLHDWSTIFNAWVYQSYWLFSVSLSRTLIPVTFSWKVSVPERIIRGFKKIASLNPNLSEAWFHLSTRLLVNLRFRVFFLFYFPKV